MQNAMRGLGRLLESCESDVVKVHVEADWILYNGMPNERCDETNASVLSLPKEGTATNSPIDCLTFAACIS